MLVDEKPGLGGDCVILKVGGAGGSVTLLGQPIPSGEWRFALTTVDHTAELVSEEYITRVERQALERVDSWEEGLRLLDRYPWVRLHPVYVHPEFVERVRAAVEERLAMLQPGPRRDKQRQAWERVLQAAATART